MRKPSFIFVSLLLIAAGILVFLSTRPASPLPITVSFLGYTNGTTGARLAMFLVTNRSTATIRRWGVFHPEIQQQPGLLSTLSIGPNVFLAPGQSEVISVSPPTNHGAWRVVLDCSRDERRLKFSDWMGHSSGGLMHAVIPDQWRSVPVQLVRSDWIDQ